MKEWKPEYYDLVCQTWTNASDIHFWSILKDKLSNDDDDDDDCDDDDDDDDDDDNLCTEDDFGRFTGSIVFSLTSRMYCEMNVLVRCNSCLQLFPACSLSVAHENLILTAVYWMLTCGPWLDGKME